MITPKAMSRILLEKLGKFDYSELTEMMDGDVGNRLLEEMKELDAKIWPDKYSIEEVDIKVKKAIRRK